MKKILFSLGFVAVASMYGQVTITTSADTTAPQASLDVRAVGAAGVADGVLVPRMAYSDAQGMTNAVESTLVWLTDGDGTCGKGFYYYDGAAWKPVDDCSTGGGTTSGPVTQNFREDTLPLLATEWLADDYTIRVSGSGTIELPAAANNAGRIITIRNGNSGTVSYEVPTPLQNDNIRGNRGQIIQSDGTNWHVIGGF